MTDAFTIAPPPPKAPPPPNYAAVVVLIGERVWGRNWPAGMGRLTGRSARNLQRLQLAARAGRDYATAPEILAQVYGRLDDVLAALAPWVPEDEAV